MSGGETTVKRLGNFCCNCTDRLEHMTIDRTAELHDEIAGSGFHPDAVSAGISDSLAGEAVEGFLVHHAPTFDRDEVRRHMSVLTLTPTRLLVAHTDESPGDHLLPTPHTSTSVEAIALSRVDSVLVTRLVSTQTGELDEAVVTIAWGVHDRIELEPARCDDPECDADHGYSGSLQRDDFSLRLSSTADGRQLVNQLLDFARRLSAATVPAGRLRSGA